VLVEFSDKVECIVRVGAGFGSLEFERFINVALWFVEMGLEE
jgi:hypothetical protein